MPPPNPPTVVKRYYPALSSVVSLDDFPESLGFIKQAIQNLFDKIHYKDLQYKKSPKGDAAFYSLTIVSRKLAIELFGSGISLVLNPDENDNTDFNISAFPVTLEYQWKILAYLRSFDLNNFSFTPQEFFELALIILNVSEEQAMAQFINTFTVPATPTTLPLEQFVNDLKQFDPALNGISLAIDENTKLTEVVQAINAYTQKYATLYAFGAYLLENDLNETKKKLGEFFKKFIPDDLETYIKDILIPTARVTLTVSAAVEFPRNILYPYKLNGAVWEREPEGSGVLSRFYFGKILLYADTQKGIGYNLDLVGDLKPTYSEIGNTGLLLQLQKLKIDISDKVNIPEADADGRPVDFRGVYADALSVTLPSKWFKSGTNTNGSTLRIGGYNLLIGTGGLSGTFALEAVPTQNASSGQITDFFTTKFSFVYPVTGLINNTVTKKEESVEIANVAGLLSYLNSLPNKNLYAFKFPLKIVPTGGTAIEFANQQQLRDYITNIVTEENGTMWLNIGSEENGFLVGFKRFDITFKQSKVTTSNIKGALEIKKFVYPAGATDAQGNSIAGQTVHIDINGHLDDNGDFNLTASAEPPFPIVLEDVFSYRVKTIELGKEGENFYIGTSGTLQFEGFLKETLKLGPIEIERLRIYSDGSFELVGGSVQLIEPIVLPLGPVEITVSAIHYGSVQKEVNGVMRKFNYFGFDGGISINPFGIEVRGDGVKYYYCVDDVAGQPKPKAYLHIQTLYLDLTLPANSGSLAIINGWVNIPEPGVSKEYAGGISLQIPSVHLAGKADIKLAPKYPAFIIDCEIEPAVPITLGTFAIYGFRGLLGYRYVAEKEAVGLVSGTNTWYEYYKFPKKGINIQKFSGPEKTKGYSTPISLGAGATLGTGYDDGYTLSIKAMALFSIPSLFIIDGRAAILTKRLGLDESQDPPFFAFVAVGDNSLEFGFGADYKLPNSSGDILSIYADIQAGFFFKNQHPWYVNIGTNINPVTARIITLLTIKSYVMLSARGIEAGARGDFNFDRNYAVIKVKAHAFVEIGGRISFEKPQFGSYLMAGVEAYIKVLFVSLSLEIGILFGVEAPKPFLIYGKFHFSIKVGIKIFGKRITLFKFSGDLEVVWNFNKNVDRSPINPLLYNTTGTVLEDIVQGVNMLSNEKFGLKFLSSVPGQTTAPTDVLNYIIPLDTYIDIKTEKGLLPGNVSDPNNSVRKLIGGINNAPQQYQDLIPPVSSIRGRAIRQVTHQYSIEEIEIRFWNTTSNKWENYHPYEALYPTDPNIGTLKIGQFQKNDGQYNAVRLLATTPFSYTENGQPGWYVPEQYGINASTLFCEGEHREHICADFLQKSLNAHYYCNNPNTPLFTNNVAVSLISQDNDDFVYISDKANVFGFAKSLAFDNRNSIELLLPQPSLMTALKLSNFANGVKLKFYSVIQSEDNDVLFNVVYGNPNPAYYDINAPYEMVFFGTALEQEIKYNIQLTSSGEWEPVHANWRPVSKIVIEPIYDASYLSQVTLLNEQIATIENNNNLIELGLIEGEIQSTELLEEQVHELTCGASGDSMSFVNRYEKKDTLNYYCSKEFVELQDFDGTSLNFIYSVGTTEKKGLVTKIDHNGDVIWEMTYTPKDKEQKLVFKDIIQIGRIINSTKPYTQCIIHAAADNHTHYLVSVDTADGSVLWSNEIVWKDIDVVVNIAPDFTNSGIYLVISDRNQIDTNKRPYVATVDSFGNFGAGVLLDIQKEEFIINGICATETGLAVAGRYIEGEYNDSVGAIVELDSNLKITRSIRIEKYYTTIHDIEFIESGRYLISGYDNKQDGIFISSVGTDGNYASYHFPNTKNHRSAVQLSAEGYYLLQNDDQNGILHFLSTDFTLQWSKEINIGGTSNGIRNFSFNRETTHITLNCYNQSKASLVAHTNKYLNTCLTNIFDPRVLKRIDIPVVKLAVAAEKSGLPFNEWYLELQRNDPKVIKYCPGGGCGEKDLKLCDLRDEISLVYYNELVEPAIVSEQYFKEAVQSFNKITKSIESFDPEYKLTERLALQLELIHNFMVKQDLPTYTAGWHAVEPIRLNLAQIGHCTCECKADEVTLLHQICWMSLEDYVYNINIPSQAAIAADAQATIDGVTQYIQPIWRPDTSYYIHFVLKDLVDNTASTTYPFTYGFTTAGPVGFFHTNSKSTYGDIKLTVGQKLLKEDNSYYTVVANGLQDDNGTLYVSNSNGFILEDTTGLLRNAVTGAVIMRPDNPALPVRVVAHPEQYALTSAKQYIDYNRSYPNADGNLLSAKPMFYNDEAFKTTQIFLFFDKAYATHFFKKWESYKKPAGATVDNAVDGRIKIVIKDPLEGVEIINPPYLDYDENDTTYTNIPQTEEIWEVDENPQVPFALSNYLNLYNAPNCIGQVTVIKPASEYITVFPKNLKPNKLYTVIVNNLFDVDHNGSFADTATVTETREVHRFVFKTSRYKDFETQINSFSLEKEINGVLAQRDAVFHFGSDFTILQLNGAYQAITGQPITGFTADVLQNLEMNYQHPFDKVFEGILGLKPWDEAISTEVNIVKDTISGNIIAIIVRNPEPFNNPRMPVEEVYDTVKVLSGNAADNNYKALFSKDYAQVIFMHNSGAIQATAITLQFTYKMWDGTGYAVTGNPVALNINLGI